MRLVITKLGWLAAMMFIIALLCAPSSAQAHAGHSHEAVLVSMEPNPGTNAVDLPDVQASAYLSSHDVKHDLPIKCLGGCCTSASHACCALVEPLAASLAGTAFIHSRVTDGTSRALLDHRPSAQGKPPRSFA